ncbi:MAG: thiamine pyrophosphate-dependent enzyme [Clostridia bacterium]
MKKQFETMETAWCPGCGNFAILESLREVLNDLGLKPHEVLVVGGIGQAAKTPQYINANGFCGLHGRALPAAAAAKIANSGLTVIVDTGDGDSYGEGGNHFIHNIRRNVDFTHFVHDNQIYGLTKGQASPTTDRGHVTGVQTLGTLNEPMNPLLVALAMGAGFVARAFTGNREHLKVVMKEAIQFRGYALVDILQPCVSFNKVNTYQWYKKRVYDIGQDHDPSDRLAAMKKAMEWGEKIPIGILYQKETPLYHDRIPFLADGTPLVDMPHDMETVRGFLKDFM